MSVSSTSVRTWTRFRSAILSSVVPPLTFDVAEAMTVPRSTSFSMIVPVIGARTSVSSSWMRGVVDGHARAHHLGARVGVVEQRLLVLLLGDRLALEQLVGPALLAGGVGQLGLGHVEVRLGLRERVARVARIDARPAGAPRLTSWPVSALSWRTSPEAFDLTSTVVSGWMAPAAWADTTMSRCSTGTAR